ncbi:putative Diguanylate cyclase [uncultured delta proteobacterium]|uniref:Putative Diguanylate cyclase n=1 Tax=uncultured delta proteobacterium TaxID=34034 RepID=A0A212JM40_9DELT|nr:putative Diguanylate cyclase [uncultured delta proteobacterium]
MPQKPPDFSALNLEPQLIKKLEDVLRKIQEKIAVERSPGHKFALIHLVEELSLEEWHSIASQLELHGWLALPLDKEDGVPLERLRQTLEELTRQRDHDFLTGLANRRLFDRMAHQELQRALRTETPLSLVMIDIDDFKDVNDTYGHAVGDKVLAALGDLLEKSLRAYDLAARLGGEEFCLMLPGATSIQAYDLAMRILDDFRAVHFESASGERFSCTFSAGVATSRNRPGRDTVTDLLRQADDFLYQAKSLGKNRVCTMVARHVVSENPALVQVAEKQFLFTGKMAQ